MALKQHIEEALKKCEFDKERSISLAKEKATRESVIPYNVECDKLRDAAIAKLTSELNENIAALQKAHADKKQAIIDANEQKKNSNAEVVLAAAVASEAEKYDKIIESLRGILESAKE